MAFSLGSLIGAGISTIGGLLGNRMSAGMQYDYQKTLQESQQNWLTEMSNTAHQREMRDLRAAGLNPLLTVMGGNGASTPSSGMGSVGLTDDGAKIQQGIATALQFRQQENADAQTEAQVKNLNAQTDTEATKQKLNLADRAFTIAKTIGQNNENSVFMTRFKKAMEVLGSEIYLNETTASANQMNANTNRINANTASAKEARENRLTASEQARSLQDLKYVQEHTRGANFGNLMSKYLKKR